MGYQKAMEVAGATVHVFKEFGSYQGDWWAKVTYNGTAGWVNGSYGSCSGCDAFQAEFDYHDHYHGDTCADGEQFDPECDKCVSHRSKLAEFGKDYLDDILSQEAALAKAAENIEWDRDAKTMVDFITTNPFTGGVAHHKATETS